MECEVQIEWNTTQITTPPIKTLNQYNKILNKIGYYKAIRTGFIPKHIEDQQNANWIQQQAAQKERALTGATTAMNTFRPIYITSRNEIKLEENKSKEALWAPLRAKVESIPEKYWNQEISKANRELYPYAMEAIYWVVYLNGFYPIREFCLFMGYSPSHHHVK